MVLNYQKVWETMNSLETTICRAVSVRQVIDAAVEALERGDRQKAENLMNAAYDFIGYFIDDFDNHFKDAWKETVANLKQEQQESLDKDLNRFCYPEESKITYDETVESGHEMTADGFWIPRQQQIDDRMPPWGHSDMEALHYTDEEMDAMCDNAAKQDKVIRWQLPVEEIENGDTGEQEYFITFPDDLLEAANLSPGEEVEWVDRNDGSFLLRKITKPLGMDEC